MEEGLEWIASVACRFFVYWGIPLPLSTEYGKTTPNEVECTSQIDTIGCNVELCSESTLCVAIDVIPESMIVLVVGSLRFFFFRNCEYLGSARFLYDTEEWIVNLERKNYYLKIYIKLNWLSITICLVPTKE